MLWLMQTYPQDDRLEYSSALADVKKARIAKPRPIPLIF
jgi:hypothetical protein